MLPSLPKQNKHKEADFGLKLRSYLERNPAITSSMEIKDTNGKDYLLFSEVKQSQIDWALAIQSDKGVLIRTTGIEGLPDYIYMRKEPAYFIVKYPKSFSIISVGTFLLEKQRSKRKSLTEQRASEISIKTIKVKG